MPALPTPARGEVIFHAACKPALEAGDYQLRVRHDVERRIAADGRPAGERLDLGGKPLPGERSYDLTIDGPRFTLDGGLIHAVFPPTNGRGAYVSRLPMIVLRRRTLPWERSLTAPAAGAPWMALLVFEEGEVTTVSPCTVGQVLDADGIPNPARLEITGVDAVTRLQPCIAIDVPLALFHDIAPMASEIPLLCHVRQVNTEDKELLGMDDDGWFAVVVGNRIPEPSKKYVACLVSLEGAENFLPNETQAAELTASDAGRPPRELYETHAAGLLANAVFADAGVDRQRFATAIVDTMVATRSKYGFLTEASGSSTSKVSAIRDSAWHRVRDVDGRFIDVMLQPDTIRLFCLAQWSFECLDGGDFEAIMQALPNNGGVAMLGMPPALARAPGAAGAAVWRAALDTGHVPLEHLTREGERTIAWYRGPLTPVGVQRSAEGPFHTSDQARRIDPVTGLENLGYAAAFEIGRLLALSDPRFALDLLRWRRGDRITVESGITFDVVHDFADRFVVGLRFEPRIIFELPAHLAATGITTVKDVIAGGVLGPLGDPSGLREVRNLLPGLDATRVAMVRNYYNVAAVQGILAGVPIGSGELLDQLGIGVTLDLERNLDTIAAAPDRHMGHLGDAFDTRLRDLTRGTRRRS